MATDGTQRVEIDGDTYELLQWPYKIGQKWAFQLVRALAPAVASHDDERAAISAVLEQLDEATLVAFSDACEAHTNLVTRDPSGRELVQPLSKVAAVHMRGKYFVMASLMRAHGEAQFGSFFARLGELFRGGAAAAESKAT